MTDQFMQHFIYPVSVALLTFFMCYGIPYKKMFYVIAKFIKNVSQKLKVLQVKFRKLWERLVGIEEKDKEIEALKTQHADKLVENNKQIELCWKYTSMWRNISWFCSLKDDQSKGVVYTIIKDDGTEYYEHYINRQYSDHNTHFNLYMYTKDIDNLTKVFNGEELECKDSMKSNIRITYTFKDNDALMALRYILTSDTLNTNKLFVL